MTRPARTVAIIQARMSSTRLPGKILQPLCGKPLILFMIERLRRSASLDEIVVATSEHETDDPLAQILGETGVKCVRGSLADVLSRFVLAAETSQADYILRLTADCPLIDPDLVDRVAGELTGGGHDYVSNTNPPTFPDGLDVEGFTRAALMRAHREATTAHQREHVTVYIRESGLFTQACVHSPVDLSELRWTVDYPDDLEVVRRLAAGVQGDPVEADRYDFLRVVDRDPNLAGYRHDRNEGAGAAA